MYLIIKQDEVRVQLAVLDVSKRQLAEKAGISAGYFSQIYNGKSTSMKTAESIAIALGGKVEDYFSTFIGNREITFI